MNICIRICATLSLALVGAHAVALPTLRVVAPTFYQTGSSLAAGLIVEASTNLPVLVIGGGFTIACSTSMLTQTAERLMSYSDFFGPRRTLLIPAGAPRSYAIPGWSNVRPGTCEGECTLQYKGEARDETSLSVRAGSTGLGANFSLIPAGEQMSANTRLVSLCKAGRPQCCTPLCAIP
jgi:hypothetical protein